MIKNIQFCCILLFLYYAQFCCLVIPLWQKIIYNFLSLDIGKLFFSFPHTKYVVLVLVSKNLKKNILPINFLVDRLILNFFFEMSLIGIFEYFGQGKPFIFWDAEGFCNWVRYQPAAKGKFVCYFSQPSENHFSSSVLYIKFYFSNYLHIWKW